MTDYEIIQQMLDNLSMAEDEFRAIVSQSNRLREEILAPVQDSLDELEEEFQPKIDDALRNIEEHKQRVNDAVLRFGKTVKSSTNQAVYNNGRTSWDTKGLMTYSEENLEVLRFLRPGKPYITYRMVSDG